MKGIRKRRSSGDHSGYVAIERNVLTARAERCPHTATKVPS
jgi:hypothetical protein